MQTASPAFLRLYRGRNNVPTYPLGVVAASLQPEWDQKRTVGLQTTPTKFFPTSTGSLPTGMTFDNFDVTNACTNLDGCTANTTDWDFADSKVQALNATNAIIQRSHLRYKLYSGRLIQMYDTSILELIDSDIDGTNSGSSYDTGTVIGHGLISDVAGSTLKLTRCRLYGAPCTYGDMAGTFILTNCYIECFGIYTSWDAHVESFSINQGNTTFSHCVLDLNDGGTNLGGLTGALYLLARTGDTNITLSNSIFSFPSAWGLGHAIATSGGFGFALTVTVTNCAIRKGTVGYFLAYPTENTTIIDGGGNVDFDTGASIDVTYP